MEGIYELHWVRREYGQLELAAYRRDNGGQLAFLDKFEAGPFDGVGDCAVWLSRLLAREHLLSLR